MALSGRSTLSSPATIARAFNADCAAPGLARIHLPQWGYRGWTGPREWHTCEADQGSEAHPAQGSRRMAQVAPYTFLVVIKRLDRFHNIDVLQKPRRSRRRVVTRRS